MSRISELAEEIKRASKERATKALAAVKEEEVYVDEVKEARRLAKIKPEEKRSKIMELRRQGMSVAAIADLFGITQKEVLTLITQHVENYRAHLESQPAANVLAEHLDFLDYMEELCLYELNLVRTGPITIDGTTGKVRSGNVSAKNVFIKNILKAREMKMNLQTQTGVLPKQAERIYHTLESNKISDSLGSIEETRDPDEIKKNLLLLLRRGRSV